MIYLCAVTSRFPENYEIGIRSGLWGVEERYAQKIEPVRRGDRLVFLVGGEFRSVHEVLSEPFVDETVLWPDKDGDVFPHRVRIGPATHRGHVAAGPLVKRISFMRDKERWTGTVQGPHGVFNNRLTEEDLELIASRMRKTERREIHLTPAEPRRREQRVPLAIFEDQLQGAVNDLLKELNLEPLEREAPTLQVQEGEGYAITARDRATGDTVVVAVDSGRGSAAIVLQVLRWMSALRQQMAANAKVRSLVLTDHLQDDLLVVAREIPNLAVRRYKMRFELDSEPDHASNGNGVHVA